MLGKVIYTVHSNTIYGPWFGLYKTKPKLVILQALLDGASFHATCLAMMICAAFQLQGEECYTLQRVCAFISRKASRMLQRACVRSRCYGNIARQVAERVLHDATLKKIVAIVAESRTRFYFVQRLVQLVSQRF